MSKPLQIQLLEMLKPYGVGRPVNIADFIKDNFHSKANVPAEEYQNMFDSITIFLSEMENSKWINQNQEDQGIWMQFEHDGYIIPEWHSSLNETNELYYFLTISGSAYLSKYQKKYLNWWHKMPFWVKTLATWITIIGGIIAIYQFFIDKYNKTHDKKRSPKTEETRSPQKQPTSMKSTLKPSRVDSSHK